MRRPRRRASLRRASLLFLAAILSLLAVGAWSVLTPAGRSAPKLITISEGQSVSEVASLLDRTDLIRSPHPFVAAAYLTGKWRRIQAGRHELDAGMTGLEILDALCRGSRKSWRWLTIPEGHTLRQIARKIEDEGLGSADDFLAAARRSHSFETAVPIPGDTLEGYLFPDTYRIESSQSERGIIAQMLRRFDQVVWHDLFDGRPTFQGRTISDIIVLASLVEAEAKRDDERPTIAGVFINRLARGQRLECDATVQYALGENRKSRLMHEDLLIESDYNTYLHPGLPPGPICSPGEASIRAAMSPADVPYLYYVAGPDGSHVFSRTFADHQAAIARIRRQAD